MIIEADLAWLAGAFDGEGCVGLYDRGKATGYCYFVTISNSDPAFILKAHRIIAGLCVDGKGRTKPYFRTDKRRGNRRPSFAIVCQNKAASLKVLTAIRPYLSTKAEQADVMIAAIQCRGSDAHGSNRAFLEICVARIKALKAPDGNAEVMLQGLRSATYRNEYQVSPNNNLGTSVRRDNQLRLIS